VSDAGGASIYSLSLRVCSLHCGRKPGSSTFETKLPVVHMCTVTCIGCYSNQVGLQRVACNLVHLGHLLLSIGQQRLQRDQLLNPAIVGVPVIFGQWLLTGYAALICHCRAKSYTLLWIHAECQICLDKMDNHCSRPHWEIVANCLVSSVCCTLWQQHHTATTAARGVQTGQAWQAVSHSPDCRSLI